MVAMNHTDRLTLRSPMEKEEAIFHCMWLYVMDGKRKVKTIRQREEYRDHAKL